ncbi:hypothetical protein MNBD_GAMMA21-2286 [hydrothermal vent metagenome]|uniref:FHA domain-containing protein n=1 Tax=hydrothermal vent metagenome TaxID=652676 RepID=A0A3B1AGN1_9ZZZZ
MATLILIQDDHAGVRFVIEKAKFLIGRGSDNDISLDDELVSKCHAIIEVIIRDDDKNTVEYFLHDQDSTNYSFVNEERVSIRRLTDKDIIRIGKSNFKFIDDQRDNLDVTTKLQKTWIPGVFVTRKGDKKTKKK